MALTIIDSNLQVNGQLSCTRFNPPSGSIDNAAIAAGSVGNFIDRAKLQHQVRMTVSQTTGDAIQPTQQFYQLLTQGGSIRLYASVDTLASATTNGVTIDLHRSTGGAYSSVLSSPITIVSTSVAKTAYSAGFSVTTGSSGDLFKVVITTTGSAGTQAKGLCAVAVLYEEPS